MDTEENLEIQSAIRQGHPPTDEGPYYHEPWWESYKGGVKGYLGGAVAYTGVGAAVGAVTATVLGVAGLVASTAVLPIVSGFAAAGLLYGAHEFNSIGHIVGSGAAIAEKQEERTNSKFEALEQKIDDLKTMISDKKAGASDVSGAVKEQAKKKQHALRHRTTHIGDHVNDNKLVFWKIAGIGLLAGLAAGALLVFGGGAEHLIGLLGNASEPVVHAGSVGIITALGLFGASFGINRDIFRHIFDKTDMLFKGLFSRSMEQSPHKAQYVEKSREKSDASPIVTVVYPQVQDMQDLPPSETHFRDKRKAELALLKLDPSKTIRQ
jgi:hypothetical protein